MDKKDVLFHVSRGGGELPATRAIADAIHIHKIQTPGHFLDVDHS